MIFEAMIRFVGEEMLPVLYDGIPEKLGRFNRGSCDGYKCLMWSSIRLFENQGGKL